MPVHQRKKETTQHNIGIIPEVNAELRQFAGNLVDGVIKTVSETKADLLGYNTTEITVTDTDKENDKNLEATESTWKL